MRGDRSITTKIIKKITLSDLITLPVDGFFPVAVGAILVEVQARGA